LDDFKANASLTKWLECFNTTGDYWISNTTFLNTQI
jgi:hypothetical protein